MEEETTQHVLSVELAPARAAGQE